MTREPARSTLRKTMKRKTVKLKGNTSSGSLMKRGPEYRPISAKGKAKQTKPKHTHAQAVSVPAHTHHPNRIKNLGKFAHPSSKLPKMGVTVKATKRKSSMKGSY